MSKKIKFQKYQTRSSSYHWQQIKPNIFTFNLYVQARYQQAVNQINPNPNQKILDIGCGDGVLLSLISKKTKARLTGIDLDSDSLKFAKKKLKAKFIKASADKLPFKPNYFDYILASEIIEHLSSPKKMLTEIKRVLKPKGQAIITTPVKLFKTPEDPMHVCEYTPSELHQIILKHFTTVKITTSHPYFLKKLYTTPWFRINRFYFEPVRWFLNLFYLIFKLNLFYLKGPRPSQQLALIKK